MSDNLLSGLEKLGLDVSGMDNIFGDAQKADSSKASDEPVVKSGPKEEEFLLNKGIRCPMCDNTFYTRNIKSARVRRLGADPDLRPHYEAVDPTKYDVDSCPYCGYTAVSKFFPGENLTSVTRKLLQEGVCDKLKKNLATAPEPPATYTYDEAIDRYKLALYNAMVKNAKNYEKAYICLKISWLLRGKVEELNASGADENAISEAKAEENKFYVQAYDGFVKAVSSEDTSKLMDSTTLEYMMAQMAFKLGNLQDASRMVSRILTSQVANSSVKNKALDLKQEIIDTIKKSAK